MLRFMIKAADLCWASVGSWLHGTHRVDVVLGMEAEIFFEYMELRTWDIQQVTEGFTSLLPI